ncbi:MULTISPECIES: LuxR family transcriptional regulator [unclassified Mesorhizobium]|uniref:helix-turn-helix transcriptional regulator n=1 Tax=unclassified Mesorhizobium TaxID=325217 RepID=UPI000FE402AF|nr:MULTISPECIES: LuxR family transcriptional regulator [unclassified Mesorhizobium]RWQ12615.1 MAG: LuxR family transcriptional regulator [Mesorhizobium sp.]TGQ37766.1 LuxR family transcriptional regulator [Mesorhizobium sp. M4B.F.Ca.ET.214.01.1.1]TGQ59534.1 LuxR family transcriptional regulator [Mesorhizobium sp. M4B.F.Ca.ET.211.01.1.1]TGU34600.1 LuxR family transcriptional regulator [Mesorhizobium sp. M4B.F.Ca.ET.150.01.1.1]
MERKSMTRVSERQGLATKDSDCISLAPPGHFSNENGDMLAIKFGRFLEQTDGIAQSKQLFELLSAFALNFDCPWIAYGSLTPQQKFSKAFRRGPAVILNYPDEWQKWYFENGYHRIDPIIKASRKRSGVFLWSEVYKDASTTDEERRIFDEAATFGLRSGISVPLHGPGGRVGFMSFAQRLDRELQNRAMTYLQLAAIHFHRRTEKLISLSDIEAIPNLSAREKECILWTSRGKSSWEIGKILGISYNTVNFHVKNAKKKLDTSSRTLAAMKAMSLGIIE